MELAARVDRFARARKLFGAQDRVLLALSGGVDSVVLLHVLLALRERLGIEVRAAHFDHAMRADSAADAEWVADLCASWHVPFISERASGALHGETDARAERYRFLFEALQQTKSNRLATAHHADDQVETVIFRILRGAGLRGLSGIPVRRGPVVRPLLRATKNDILAYAAAHDLAFRDDPTNERLDVVRNRIRRTVIPALETVRPDARSAILALARYAARTEASWHELLQHIESEIVTTSNKDQIELARAQLLEYDAALRARVLRHLLHRYGIAPSRSLTRHLLQFVENAESGAALNVAGRVRLERAFDRIRMLRLPDVATPDEQLVITGSEQHGALSLGGRRFEVSTSVDDVPRTDAEHFDVAVLDASLELRGWRAGDRIRLPYGTKKLKKLFAEQRIPASERARIPVLADQSGRVLWVVGVARSVAAAPPETGPTLNIKVTNA